MKKYLKLSIIFIILICFSALSGCGEKEDKIANKEPVSNVKIGVTYTTNYRNRGPYYITLIDSLHYVYFANLSLGDQSYFDESDTNPSKVYTFGEYTKHGDSIDLHNLSKSINAKSYVVNYSSVKKVKERLPSSIVEQKQTKDENGNSKKYILIKPKDTRLVTEDSSGENSLNMFKSKVKLPKNVSELKEKYSGSD